MFRAGAIAQGPTGPKIWLQDSQPLVVNYTGMGASAPAASAGGVVAIQPVAMVQGDFDQDGINDLAVGYSAGSGGFVAIHRGNMDAFAPRTKTAFQAIAHSQFLSPFLPDAQTFAVPVRPDFIVAGDFTGHGHSDLAVASSGGSTVSILAGDGKGNFAAGQTINLPGRVTSLAGGVLGKSRMFASLLVGVSSPQQTFLAVYGGSQQGMAPVAAFPLTAPATGISLGEFGDIGPDAAFLSGGQVVLLHSSSMQLETLSLPIHANAMVLGSFVYDRNPGMQIALLDSTGSIAIAAHNEFDSHVRTQDEMRTIRQLVRSGQKSALVPRPTVATHGWQIVENIPSAAPYSSNQPPVLLRTRVSSNGTDDVMVLNPSMGQMALVSHANPVPGASTFVAGQVSTRPYAGSPVAAISARVNVDGRPGVLALHQGEMAPRAFMPLPDPTFTVNRTDDPTPISPIANACNGAANDCSLREAILKANSIAGTDTIMVPAGTYTLTIAKVANDCTGNFGALSVNDSANIVGAGRATTIIQAGATQAAGVDMVMNVNEDLGTANCPITDASASISNLTIQNGHNNGTHDNDGDGGCMEFDTGSSGNATLSLTNVTLNNCTTTQGNGGGIATFNFTNPGAGAVTVSNSIVQHNSAVDSASVGTAGGIWVSFLSRVTISNSQVINNLATQVNGGDAGTGGGITISTSDPGSPTTTIHATTISGNQAAGEGGGIDNESNLSIDQESIISNNSAGSANAVNQTDGGGIFSNIEAPDTVTLSKVTMAGNSAPNGRGGAIFHGDNSAGDGTLTIAFSRLAGNSASTPASSNLENDNTTITAINNWWGTNTPANTITTINGGATTFDPFIVLTHTASPNKIRINQSSTLTGDMSKDNHGNGAALAGNLDVLNGLPITFNNAVLGTIPQAQPEALDANAQATATYNAGNVGGSGSADATVDQQTVTASIIVLQPPSITKSFNPAIVAVNAPSTITFGITNGNTVAINASFADTLPAGLVVATPPNVVNSCGGTVTATAGSGSINFINAALPAGTCSIQVNVQSATDNIYNNSVTIDSTDAGNGNTAAASLTVINPPVIAKAFGAATVPLNGTTSLTFTLSSTNVNLTLNGVAFSDNLPAGLVVATPSNLSSTCGGTVTAVSGTGNVSLSGATLAPGASCTVSVNVTGTTSGVKSNSVQVTSTNGGTGNTSTASITVVSPPVITKAFGAASIPLNGSTSLTFTIQNINTTTTLTGVSFSDTLPSGLIISTPNGLTGACGGGTITATQGTNVISLTGASLAANSSCTFSVNVTGTAAGLQVNTTGNVTSNEGGTGGTASASIKVEAPPSIAKVFNPSSIALNATTSLTFTITNPAANVDPLTGVAFTDTLPTGLTVPSGTTAVCGGTLTTTAPTGIALSGATIAVNSQCIFSVTVTGAASGLYTNTTGAVTSTNGGTGNTASANLTVASPPSITKAFGAASIPFNGTTSLTFSITNPNAGLALTGLAFTDNLPAGLVVATPANLNNTCGGTATAVAGSGSVSLSAGTVASSASCTVSVNVTGTTAGVKNNSVSITSTEGGTGNTSTASITVVSPPVTVKAFGTSSIPIGGSTSLSFTIQNLNTTTALTGVGFTDTLPAGLIISTPNGLTGSCGGGTITATQNTNTISLSGGSVPANSSCTFSVNVTGTAAGTQINTTSNVTSNEGGTGGTATASIVVVAPPSIAKAFNPSSIALNATTQLTFTITNPAANAVALTGVAFVDTLPTGLTVGNASTAVCGGTLTTTSPTGIALSGATIAVNSQCQFSVTVTGAASGQFTNTTGAVSSTNGGTGNTATASLTVASAPSIAKAFGAAAIPVNGTTSLTFNITNPNSGLALSGLAFSDSLPAGLVVATPSNLNNTCGGTATAVGGSGAVTLSGGTVAASASCTVSVNVTGTTGGVKNNSVTVTSTTGGTGNTATASITVVGPPLIAKAFGAASIPLLGSTSLTFTIQNNNPATSLSGVGFTDSLPFGLVVAIPNGLTGSCGGGTITATQGLNNISLAGATLAANTSCTFSVNVTGFLPGPKTNTTGHVTSNEGGTGGTATASINVVAPPLIAKSFVPNVIAPNTTSALTFVIVNPFVNTVGLTGVAFTDSLPANIKVATPNGLTGSCGGGTITAVSGSGSISLAGGTIAAGGSCTFSVNVTGSIPGSYVNTTGAVTSANGGTGNQAFATLFIRHAKLSITKTHYGDFFRGQDGARYFLTVSNAPDAGPTTGTVTVVDHLPDIGNPHNLVPVSLSGTGWTCTLSTLTCTRTDALAPGMSYPTITFTVNIPHNIGDHFTNTATVSGGGDPDSHTAFDPVKLNP